MAIKMTVRGIIYDANSRTVLCQKLKSYQNTTWYLPGGRVEDGESLVQALERELMEECGVVAEVGRLIYINQYFDGTDHVTAFIFNIHNVEDFREIDLDSTTHGSIEIAAVEFISQHSEILPRSMTTLDLKKYTTEVMPVFIDDERLG